MGRICRSRAEAALRQVKESNDQPPA